MKKVNTENIFLTIWIFCVGLLTLLFPVSFIRGTRSYFGDNMSGQLGAGYQIKYVSNFPIDLVKTDENRTDSVVSEIYVVADNTFEADGYEFVGWNTKSDGTGKVYEVKEVYYDKLNLILYAQWKKIEVVVISYGDINLNGIIDEEDCLLLENHVSGISELSGQALLNADVNTDGNVNLVDVDIIKQAYLGTDGYVNILPSNPILIYEIYKEENVQEPVLPDKPTEDDDIEPGNENDSNAGGENVKVEDGETTADDSSINNTDDSLGNIGQGTESGDNSSSGSTGTGSSGSSGGGGKSPGSGNDSGADNGNKPSTENSNDNNEEEDPKEDKEEVEEDKDNVSSKKEEKKTGDSIIYVLIIVFGICLLSFRLILYVIYKFRQNNNENLNDK